MKSKLNLMALLCAISIFTGCASLEEGGAYHQTGQAPQKEFYAIDTAYSIANGTLDVVFQYEYDNRAALWKLSPDIKRTLDKIRPQAWKAGVTYQKARTVYLANPTPAGLTTLRTTLSKLEGLAMAVNAALPKE